MHVHSTTIARAICFEPRAVHTRTSVVAKHGKRAARAHPIRRGMPPGDSGIVDEEPTTVDGDRSMGAPIAEHDAAKQLVPCCSGCVVSVDAQRPAQGETLEGDRRRGPSDPKESLIGRAPRVGCGGIHRCR